MSRPEDISTEIDPRSEPSDPMAFELRVMQGADVGASLRVEANSPSRMTVGKSAACQLVLQDPRISRRHLALEISGVRLRVSDLGSTNGTTVNGVDITEATLQGGEVLGLGDTLLHVERRPAQTGRVPNAVQFGRLIGASLAMRRLYPLCERLAASAIPVIIEGESGTGKELLAEELHARGPRRGGPFVVFDCASTAPARADELLFGEAVPGTSRGLFEAASGGTLLIDEIAELPAAVQGKLLRVIERGEMCRTGSDQSTRVDVRVIATTRRDLEKEVEAGRLREDLYFRLAIERIELPPLRKRRGDEILLANYFAREAGSSATLPPDFLRRYDGYGWPGNVRELANAVARRLALGDTTTDELEEEPDEVPADAFDWMLDQDLPFSKARDTVLAEFEHRYVERVLSQHGGNVSRAAEASGLARRYFQVIRARVRR